MWTGCPDPRIKFSLGDLFLIPFSLVWGGFALAWNIGVWWGGAPLCFRLWGLPFLLVGAYITIGRFVISARRKQRTTYAITTQRAIIIDDRAKVRYVEMAEVLHETRTVGRGRGISVEFRLPSQTPSSRMWGFIDPRLTGMPNNSRQLGDVAASSFLFQGVGDSLGLLHALDQAPTSK